MSASEKDHSSTRRSRSDKDDRVDTRQQEQTRREQAEAKFAQKSVAGTEDPKRDIFRKISEVFTRRPKKGQDDKQQSNKRDNTK